MHTNTHRLKLTDIVSVLISHSRNLCNKSSACKPSAGTAGNGSDIKVVDKFGWNLAHEAYPSMTANHCRTNRRSRLLKFVVHILFYEDLRLDTFRRESEDKLSQSMLIGSHRCLQQSFIAPSRSTMPWARYSQLLPVNVCLWWSNLCSDVIWSALGLEFKLFNSSYFGGWFSILVLETIHAFSSLAICHIW
jgi:hypothetical protein